MKDKLKDFEILASLLTSHQAMLIRYLGIKFDGQRNTKEVSPSKTIKQLIKAFRITHSIE